MDSPLRWVEDRNSTQSLSAKSPTGFHGESRFSSGVDARSKKSQDSTCGNICADGTGVGSASARPSSAFSCSDKKNGIDEKDLQRMTSDSPCAASWKKSQVDNRVRESPSSQIIARQPCARKDAAEEYDRNVAASSKPPIQSVKPPSQMTPCAKKCISAEQEFRSSTSPCAKVNDEKRESVLRELESRVYCALVRNQIRI